jgi:hypothetical protein
MTILNFIIAVIALVVAVLAYQKAGGIADLNKQVELMGSVRDKAADLLAKLEKKVRKQEAEEDAKEKKEKST